MKKTLLPLLALSFLAASCASAQAQRVLECRFVSVEPKSFVYGQWSFAADISGGYLHLLLTRPTDADPSVTPYEPLRPGISVHKDVPGTTGGADSPTAHFEMATLGPDETVVIDQWDFGGTESYDRLTLHCPSHQ